MLDVDWFTTKLSLRIRSWAAPLLRFKAGDTAVLSSIPGQPELDGRRVEVRRWLRKRGKYKVVMPDGSKAAVEPERLRSVVGTLETMRGSPERQAELAAELAAEAAMAAALAEGK